MRNAFAAELTELASKDERIVMLSGDIGNRLFNDFKDMQPDRFFNCGAAEANMIGVAAGMALCGLRPVAYTITSFVTMRCLEQIRLDVAYQNLPVIIVGVGSGLSYASLNATHHSNEDIAALRMLPNMTVIAPGDALEVRAALRAAFKHDGPVYIRMGKKNEPVIHSDVPEFVIGKGIIIREGDDICLLNSGTLLPAAMEAADELQRQGLSSRVVSLHTVKPLDKELIAEAFARFKVVVTLEEHNMAGGLGGSVAEWLADQPPQQARLLRIGTSDAFLYEAGEQEHARQVYGLTCEAIVKKIHQTLQLRESTQTAKMIA